MSRQVRNWLILLGVAALTLAADYASKAIIANSLALYTSWHPPLPFLKAIFSFTYTTNTGAAFGLFPDLSLFFTFIAFVVIGVILFYHRHLPDGLGWVRLALGLQLGGALGNLADRLIRGHVVDFIDLNFWPLQNWPVFNLADSAIVVGVGLLALTMWREELASQPSSSEDEATGAPGASPQ